MKGWNNGTKNGWWWKVAAKIMIHRHISWRIMWIQPESGRTVMQCWEIYQMVLGLEVSFFLFPVCSAAAYLAFILSGWESYLYFRMSSKRCMVLPPFRYCTENNICANCFMSRKYHGCGLHVSSGIAYVSMLASCACVLNQSWCVPVLQLQDNNLSFYLETKNDISIVMISYLYVTCFCVVNDIWLWQLYETYWKALGHLLLNLI